MTEFIILSLGICAVWVIGNNVRDEWRASRSRRNRDELRHVIGARPWWGRR